MRSSTRVRCHFVRRGSGLTWHFQDTDPDFGQTQAKNLQLHFEQMLAVSSADLHRGMDRVIVQEGVDCVDLINTHSCAVNVCYPSVDVRVGEASHTPLFVAETLNMCRAQCMALTTRLAERASASGDGSS